MKGARIANERAERKIRQINRRIEYYSTEYVAGWEEDATCRTYLIKLEEKLWTLEDALAVWEQKRQALVFVAS